jgi:mannose-6-phosphate isomerase-like protein (cupin superfamily)
MMKNYNCIRKVGWDKITAGLNVNLKTKLLLDEKNSGSKEFVVTYSELEPGNSIPMHSHEHAHSDYFISGRVWAQFGCRKVELEVDSATYFPVGIPHAYEAVGHEMLRFYSIYACEEQGQAVQTIPVDLKIAQEIDRPNMDQTRWAVTESYETWFYWEPSKGPKGLRWTSLFDLRRGGHKEMIVGTLYLPPGGRYSKHYHEQPEVFIGLEGRGILFCGDEEIEIEPGIAAYVGKNIIHGAQTIGARSLKMIWVYGTELAGDHWSWTPAEDIYLGEQPLNRN